MKGEIQNVPLSGEAGSETQVCHSRLALGARVTSAAAEATNNTAAIGGRLGIDRSRHTGDPSDDRLSTVAVLGRRTGMDIRLDGKSAVITGGSKGLGLAIAEEYAKSGADVAILARDRGTLAEAKATIQAGAPGGKVAAISCDVSTAADIRKTYDQIMSEFGKIDIYVNNAGQSTRGPSETLTDEMWQADLVLKLFAQIRFCRLVFPQMKQRRWGRIISVLNIGAKAPGADSAPTSVSRAAQMAFTKALSQEGAPHNVLVNSLHVGVIVSDQIVRRHQREGANVSLEEFIAQAGRAVPLGRMGRAEEFANVACFLASDAASYVTGCAINVDGGRSPVV